ncbi:hypothetical protein [Streptomyces sp. NPDC057250]|uniref:hypothetical protein n=1 Tax=Streptomyces sp. NPDC057250 TaxID=3346068 RepID=UPI00362DD9F5
MSETTEDETREDEPDVPEFRVRDVFQFRRSKPDPAEADDVDQEPAPAEQPAPVIPPMPAGPPPIPAARVGRAARADDHRVPHWRDPVKDLTLTGPCKHPKPYTFRMGDGRVIPHWCPDCKNDLTPAAPAVKAEEDKPADGAPEELPGVSKDDDEPGGEAEDDEEDGEEEDGPSVSLRERWKRGVQGTAGRSYSRPVYGKTTDEQKKSLLDVWNGRSQKSRHLLYNGAALAGGWYLGVPQFFTEEVAYLVATYDSWTHPYVCVWYGVAVGVWVLDYRTRNWFPAFAVVTRVPLISMIVGVLLYGTPLA